MSWRGWEMSVFGLESLATFRGSDIEMNADQTPLRTTYNGTRASISGHLSDLHLCEDVLLRKRTAICVAAAGEWTEIECALLLFSENSPAAPDPATERDEEWSNIANRNLRCLSLDIWEC